MDIVITYINIIIDGGQARGRGTKNSTANYCTKKALCIVAKDLLCATPSDAYLLQ